MQVKKFEAPTIQEALEVIKRELGPEAIILQTKKLKKGFGLMNKESVEVTAAVSERSIQKKSFAEHRLRDSDKEAVKKLPANRQGDLYDKYMDRQMARASQDRGAIDDRAGATRDRVDVRGQAAAQQKRLTATRYADIDDSPAGRNAPSQASAAHAAAAAARAQAQARAQQQAAAAAGGMGMNQAQTLQEVAQGRIPPQGAVMGQLGAGMSVEEELRHLKRMIEEMKTAQDGAEGSGASAASHGALGTPALQDAFEQLVLNGMDKRFAYGLVKKAAFEIGEEKARNPEYVLDQLAVEVMESTEVVSPLASLQGGEKAPGQGPVVIALVGPTGVGKTTTVAKMASDALLKRNLKVGLINLDSYKVAAFDQLATYAKILNVPFRSCATTDDLRVAIRDFQALDLVIVDTTGRSQRDPASLKEMQDMLQAVGDIQSQLVLSVTTRDNELYDMANRFAIFRPQGIVVSKLDEASIYGAIYNVSHKVKLPLSYFTTGQRVPEDIEEATRERVAALIMDL
jgi:flagellar biosynthesis protein FlhF